MMQQVPRMDSVTPFSACTTPRCRKLRRRARINVLLLFLATTVVLGFMAMVFLLNGGTQFISYATPVFVRMALLLSPQALTASLLP
jgi:hypothetical protein